MHAEPHAPCQRGRLIESHRALARPAALRVMPTAPLRTVWLTGLSGAGKSTLASALLQALLARQQACVGLDGDQLRLGLCRDLGFSPEDRQENLRRAAEVARLFNAAGLTVVASFISPLQADRALVRQIIGVQAYCEVHVHADVAVCERRDPKGLYRRAREGRLPSFTGISAPYEAPTEPALRLDTATSPLDECVAQLLRLC